VKRILLSAVLAGLALGGCGSSEGPAAAVTGFAEALADSDYTAAWDLLDPRSQQWYDSTVVILHHFGYTEAAPAIEELCGEMDEAGFAALTGRDLFVRMTSREEAVRHISTSIRSVEYRDSTTAVVVVRTADGPQEIPVRLGDNGWRVDISGLVPPPEEGE
jgi:hypothetical protein